MKNSPYTKMKQLLLICAVVALVGCGTISQKVIDSTNSIVTSPPKAVPSLWLETPEARNPHSYYQKGQKMADNWRIIEYRIRTQARKPTGILTKADLEKVTILNLSYNQLTDVTCLEKLTQLEMLNLRNNPDLTKAQIDELKKALPNCKIFSEHGVIIH